MIIGIIIIGILIVVGVITGLRNCEGYVIAVDVHRMNEPFFSFGVHNRRYIYMGQEVTELTIGLILINFVIEFYKNKHVG